MDSDLVDALRRRNADVLTAEEANTRADDDESQLSFAASVDRVIYTRNVKHFCRLHAEFMSSGRKHSGILVANSVVSSSVGMQLQKLRKVMAMKSASDMRNMLEFLSSY